MPNTRGLLQFTRAAPPRSCHRRPRGRARSRRQPPRRARPAAAVKSAADLHKHDKFGKQQPYCRVDCGKFTVRCKTAKDGGTSPVWGETLFFQVSDELELVVTVFAEHALSRDALLGVAVVPLGEVRQSGSELVAVPVELKGRQAGTLHAALELKGPTVTAFGQVGQGLRPPVFGAAIPGAATPGAGGGGSSLMLASMPIRLLQQHSGQALLAAAAQQQAVAQQAQQAPFQQPHAQPPAAMPCGAQQPGAQLQPVPPPLAQQQHQQQAQQAQPQPQQQQLQQQPQQQQPQEQQQPDAAAEAAAAAVAAAADAEARALIMQRQLSVSAPVLQHDAAALQQLYAQQLAQFALLQAQLLSSLPPELRAAAAQQHVLAQQQLLAQASASALQPAAQRGPQPGDGAALPRQPLRTAADLFRPGLGAGLDQLLSRASGEALPGGGPPGGGGGGAGAGGLELPPPAPVDGMLSVGSASSTPMSFDMGRLQAIIAKVYPERSSAGCAPEQHAQAQAPPAGAGAGAAAPPWRPAAAAGALPPNSIGAFGAATALAAAAAGIAYEPGSPPGAAQRPASPGGAGAPGAVGGLASEPAAPAGGASTPAPSSGSSDLPVPSSTYWAGDAPSSSRSSGPPVGSSSLSSGGPARLLLPPPLASALSAPAAPGAAQQLPADVSAVLARELARLRETAPVLAEVLGLGAAPAAPTAGELAQAAAAGSDAGAGGAELLEARLADAVAQCGALADALRARDEELAALRRRLAELEGAGGRGPCFASMTSARQGDGGGGAGATRAMPLFMVASAAEAKPSAAASSAPSWRLVAANLAAGATAGCAVEAALYPIDTIKTRLQAMIGGGGIKALLSSGGGRGLYAGVWGNLAGVAPSSAIFMAVYEPVKHWVYRNSDAEQHWLGPVLAGAAAGAAASLTRVPTEVIKQRLQTREFAGALGAVRAILAREGVRGLYAGYGAFLLRDLPFDAIEFVAYEQLRKAAGRVLRRDPNPLEVSLVGAVAGGFTGIVTTPLDVLKTRLMTQGTSGRYTSLLDATLTIARTEGLAAFMSGWQPRLIWISLGGFVFFPALEAAKKLYSPDGAAMHAPPTDAAFVIEELEAEAEARRGAKRGGGGGGKMPLSAYELAAGGGGDAARLCCAILLLNSAAWLLQRSRAGYAQQHRTRLLAEIAALRKQAAALNAPATYAKAAKAQRLANAKEKELAGLASSPPRGGAGGAGAAGGLAARAGPALAAAKAALIALAVVAWWGRALLHIPPALTWPFDRLLAFPHASNHLDVGAVTVLPWVAVCDRASRALARALFPQQLLDLRTSPLPPLAEEPEHVQ
ncbi:SAMC1 [Scenedesmus sp. PABB004]|nr:SAMC1 [Scenedesmus sp. PABB004]